MNKKIIMFLCVLLVSVSFVCAENNTTETSEIDETLNYILSTSISEKGIAFSDGFTGFSINSSKADIASSDEFILGSFSDSEIENTIKLAIIESYKQNREDQIGDIISKIITNSYKSDDEVIKEVMNSDEKIGTTEVVEISNESEATFNFELLESVDENKSDCIAYTVSIKTIPHEDKLTASENDTDVSQKNDEKNNTDTQKEIKNETKTKNSTDTPKESKNNVTNQTVVNEINKTIITKTNTTIINETNTTIINRHNINNTTEAPQNDSATSTLLKTVGNPIVILIIALAVVAIAVVGIRRKG